MNDGSAYTRNQSSLFLIEVIIAVFFFAITAVVCIRIFVKAHIVSEKSQELTQSYIEADNIAQVFINSGANIDLIISRYSEYAVTLSQEGDYTGTILILYDSDFKPIPNPTDNINQTIESTAYELILTQSLEDALDVYEGLNSYEEAGYACKASIYIYDIQLSDTLITDTYFENLKEHAENRVLALPIDLYLGDIDTGA
jgi:hypothetical protein